MINKLLSIAYALDLPVNLGITLIFNVEDLTFHRGTELSMSLLVFLLVLLQVLRSQQALLFHAHTLSWMMSSASSRHLLVAESFPHGSSSPSMPGQVAHDLLALSSQ